MKFRPGLLVLFLLAAFLTSVAAQHARRTSVVVHGLERTSTGRRAADKLRELLALKGEMAIADRDESRAAATGAGYAGSLNLTLAEARDLGAAFGAEFYFLVDAETQRRTLADGTAYYDAYAAIFLVSTRTGRLVMWDVPSFENARAESAETLLLAELAQRAARYAEAISKAQARERNERERAFEQRAPLIEDAPDEDSPASAGLRLPAPYRRLQPAYTETAARAGAEGVVDVLVEIDASGEVSAVEVVRWAGYGLDEATVNTVRQLHFRPALRDGSPVPLRVLLRYNFRRPAK